MDKTLIEIRRLEAEENNDELSSFLIQLAKYGEQPLKYENEFRKHFNSSDWCLRKVAVFCLLFALQIDKPEYRSKALEFVNDKEEDEEVRRWAAAGLAQTYRNTKDRKLLKLFTRLIEDNEEDDLLKESLLSSALLIYGLSSRDQWSRNSSVSPKLNEMLQTFDEEMTGIRALVKS